MERIPDGTYFQTLMNRSIFLFDLDDTLVDSGYAGWVACTELLNDFLQSKGAQDQYSSEYLKFTWSDRQIHANQQLLLRRLGGLRFLVGLPSLDK